MRPETDALAGLLLVGFVLWLVYRRRPPPIDLTSHGTGGLATAADCRRAGLHDGDRVLGRDPDGRLLWVPPSAVHVAVFAMTGAGKGVSLLTPWLLKLRGSCVVLDPKSEQYVLTHRYRRTLGPVYRLAPYDPDADTWNVLDQFPPSTDTPDVARAVASALVWRSADGDKDPHWNDRAEDVITALLTYVMLFAEGPDRSLNGVRDAITTPGGLEHVGNRMLACGGIVGRLGGLLLGIRGEERDSVLSTVSRHTSWLDSLPLSRNVSSSSFDMARLLDGDLTVYLCLPPAHQAAGARWQRLCVAAITRLVAERGMRKGALCHALLDEASTLGHLEVLESGLTMLRSYGLIYTFFFQSVGQLKAVFRDRESVLLDNVSPIFFSVNNNETAEYVSKRIGVYTHVSATFSVNGSRSWAEDRLGNPGVTVSLGDGTGYQTHAREVLKPDEVMNLPRDVAVAFFPGLRGVAARLVRWFEEPELVRRAS
ncbi:MAG: hypothetical protein C0501_26430 [Isosphaera sp.]|nr:hypothetical protein [Isosphaera sp.]